MPVKTIDSSQSAEEISYPQFRNKIEAEDETVRVEWVDGAKRVGIILVVIGHTLRGLESADVISFRGYFWAD